MVKNRLKITHAKVVNSTYMEMVEYEFTQPNGDIDFLIITKVKPAGELALYDQDACRRKLVHMNLIGTPRDKELNWKLMQRGEMYYVGVDMDTMYHFSLFTSGLQYAVHKLSAQELCNHLKQYFTSPQHFLQNMIRGNLWCFGYNVRTGEYVRFPSGNINNPRFKELKKIKFMRLTNVNQAKMVERTINRKIKSP